MLLCKNHYRFTKGITRFEKIVGFKISALKLIVLLEIIWSCTLTSKKL